jgi:SAM-dependent methyltransferase
MNTIKKIFRKSIKRAVRVPDRFFWWWKIRSVFKNDFTKNKSNKVWEINYIDSLLHHSHQNKLISLDFLKAIKKRKLFLDQIKNSNSILELACGTGELSHFINQKYNTQKIIGLEISESAVKIADFLYSNNNLSFVKINPEDKLNEFGKFDTVICSQLLEHFSKPDIMIEKMFEVAPVVIAIIPYDQPIIDTYTEEGGGGHVYRFTEDSFKLYKIIDSVIFETLGWDYSSKGETPKQLAVLISKKD